MDHDSGQTRTAAIAILPASHEILLSAEQYVGPFKEMLLYFQQYKQCI